MVIVDETGHGPDWGPLVPPCRPHAWEMEIRYFRGMAIEGLRCGLCGRYSIEREESRTETRECLS